LRGIEKFEGEIENTFINFVTQPTHVTQEKYATYSADATGRTQEIDAVSILALHLLRWLLMCVALGGN